MRKKGSGRPKEHLDKEDEIEAAIKDNYFVTVRELSDVVGIPRESVRRLIHGMDYQKKSCRWVPKRLSDEQKHCRVNAAQQNLQLIQAGELVMENVITLDEKQFARFTHRGKRSSYAWQKPKQPRIALPKSMSSTSRTKTLYCIAMSCEGVEHLYRVPPKTTLNAEKYLQMCVLPAVQKLQNKRGANVTIHLLHDNARPHVAKSVRDALVAAGVSVINHPTYSPDISPCDYFLFSKLTKGMAGKLFDTADDLQTAIEEAISQIPQEKFLNTLKDLNLLFTMKVIILMNLS